MRYTAPVLAALLVAGCCCTPEAAVQNDSPPQPAAEAPLLKDLPILGRMFEQPKAKETRKQPTCRCLRTSPFSGRCSSATLKPTLRTRSSNVYTRVTRRRARSAMLRVEEPMRLLTIILLCLAVGCATAAVEPMADPQPHADTLETKQFREVMRTMEAAVLELKTTASYETAGEAADRLVQAFPHITRYGGMDSNGTPIREKPDFRQWADALKTAGEELRRATSNGDHKAAKAAQTEVDKACKGCHDVYGARPW